MSKVKWPSFHTHIFNRDTFVDNELTNHGRTKFNDVGKDIYGSKLDLIIIHSLFWGSKIEKNNNNIVLSEKYDKTEKHVKAY